MGGVPEIESRGRFSLMWLMLLMMGQCISESRLAGSLPSLMSRTLMDWKVGFSVWAGLTVLLLVCGSDGLVQSTG